MGVERRIAKLEQRTPELSPMRRFVQSLTDEELEAAVELGRQYEQERSLEQGSAEDREMTDADFDACRCELRAYIAERMNNP